MKKLLTLSALVAAFSLLIATWPAEPARAAAGFRPGMMHELMLPQTAASVATGFTADRLNKFTSSPGCPVAGYLYYDTTADTVKACNNALTAAVIGTSLPDLTDSAGVSVTSTVPFIVPVSASAATPTISTVGAPTFGVYFNTTLMGLVAGSSGWISTGNSAATALQLPTSGIMGWSSSGSFGAAGNQTFLRSRSAANFTFGAADVNGVPVAQTISVQNAITGSNLAGGTTFSLAASLGTGTGAPGTLVITGGDSSVASGATAQTRITRATFNNTKSLTTGAATTAVSIPLATLQMTGGTIDYYIEATDGTNQCTSKNSVQYAAENSAGVFKATVTKVIGTSVTNCTGATTLTEAWTMTSANPSLIQVTPTLTGITATRFTMIYEVHHMGNTVPTI